MVTGNSEGTLGLNGQNFKEKYEAKLEFPEGQWGLVGGGGTN